MSDAEHPESPGSPEQQGALLLLVGPPAVGKMSIGRAVCARTGYRLFHNHASIEALLETFDHGSAPFATLNVEIRRRVIEEAAAAGTRLVFTFVWGVDLADDVAYVEALVRPYADAGRPVRVVELYADLDTRLARNTTPERLAAKASKRDLAWSEANVRELDAERLNTDPDRPSLADPFLAARPHLRLDTTDLGVEESAARIVSWLDGRGSELTRQTD